MASLAELELGLDELDFTLSLLRDEIAKAKDVKNPRIKSEMMLSIQTQLVKAARELPFNVNFH